MLGKIEEKGTTEDEMVGWHQQHNGHAAAAAVAAKPLQSCLTLYDPMNWSTPGLPVPHHPPKFAQGHVYCFSDAVQSSHLLTASSPSALNLSQHQGLCNESAVHIR